MKSYLKLLWDNFWFVYAVACFITYLITSDSWFVGAAMFGAVMDQFQSIRRRLDDNDA